MVVLNVFQLVERWCNQWHRRSYWLWFILRHLLIFTLFVLPSWCCPPPHFSSWPLFLVDLGFLPLLIFTLMLPCFVVCLFILPSWCCPPPCHLSFSGRGSPARPIWKRASLLSAFSSFFPPNLSLADFLQVIVFNLHSLPWWCPPPPSALRAADWETFDYRVNDAFTALSAVRTRQHVYMLNFPQLLCTL